MNNKQILIDEMSKTLCKSAGTGHGPVCLQCFGDPQACMWQCFRAEAEAALETVKQYCLVQYRSKPRK